MGAFGMILEIILPLFKKKTRKDFHTKFGTMTCEFGKEDQYFYWHIYTDRFNKNKYSTSLWIEGTQIKPDEILLEKANQLIIDLKSYTDLVQKELDSKFTSEKINLSKGYKVDYVDFGLEGELEIEYSSDEQDMVSVIFNGKNIQKLELY